MEVDLSSNLLPLIDEPKKKLKKFEEVSKSLLLQEKNSEVIDKEDFLKDLVGYENKVKEDVGNLHSQYNKIYDGIQSNSSIDELLVEIVEFKGQVGQICDTDKVYAEIEKLKCNFKATPSALLARKMRDPSKKLKSTNDLERYKLPVTLAFADKENSIRRFQLGEECEHKPKKVIMMVGMTGSGKSLMINNLVNFVYGVEYTDKFRYELIVDEEEIEEREGGNKSKSSSMTSWVSGFDLNWQEGFKTDFSLTLLDTPGFADDKGIEYDEKIVDRIRHFFHDVKTCPIQELTSIGFVIQASTARLTEEHKYVFDQVLNIFGKDMSENVNLMFTFADAQPPPALECVKTHKIPFKGSFKFNNSATYAENKDDDARFSWEFGYRNVQKFFQHVGGAEAISLTLTKDVLDEREHLKTILGALKERIDKGMTQLQSIEVMVEDILRLQGNAKCNENYKVKKSVEEQTTKVVDHYITNCKGCMFTCHDPCGIKGDGKRGCSSMKNGVCQTCPGKCDFSMHSNGDRIYVYTKVEREETIAEMCKMYDISISGKNAKKKLLQAMMQEYKLYKNTLFESITTAATITVRLEEIAMRNTYLTNVSYIERLIESERQQSRANKANRIEQLQNILQMAKILDSAKRNPTELMGHMSSYEVTVYKRIESLNEGMGNLSLPVVAAGSISSCFSKADKAENKGMRKEITKKKK